MEMRVLVIGFLLGWAASIYIAYSVMGLVGQESSASAFSLSPERYDF